MNSGRRERDSLVFTRELGHDEDRRERKILGEPPDRVTAPVAPDQADAALERRSEVVGVAFERQRELEHLVQRGVPACDRPARP